jgi:hypothetical protein
MLTNFSKKIELTTNVAIIVVSCLLATVLIKNYLLAKSTLNQTSQSAAEQPLSSLSVSSLDINWKQERQTLMLVISSTCQFCTASAPFYKKLVDRKDTRLLAVVPQSVQEGQNYLKRLQVQVDEVRQIDFSTIGVQGTPTLLLVDSAGVVKQSWVGQLSPAQESDVLKAVHPSQIN